MESYDAVIIGAGNGGLTGAAALAQKGMNVLLLERHNIPGGCATSFCRGRFEFEVALHQLSGMGSPENPGPLRNVLGKIGVLDDIEFVEMSDLYRVVIPDEFDITLKPERSLAVMELQKRFPAEKEAIEKFFDFLYDYFAEMLGAYYFRDPDVSRGKYPLTFRYGLKSTKEVLDEFFSDPYLQTALTPYWGYIGLPPSLMSFSYLAMLMYAYLEFKPFHIKGGSQALSSAILNKVHTYGGTARFNCGVKKIIVENGAVKGVVTEHEDRIETKHVLSNASKISTYVDLIESENVPGNVLTEMRGKQVACSAFTLYIGLDCEPGELGITQSTNFIMSGTDTDNAYDNMRNLDSVTDYMLLTCFDVSDPEFSPEGACQVAMVTGQSAEPWLRIPPTRYAAEKYRCADAVLNQACRVFPNMRDHIEEIEAATPLTHMRYLNHPGGAFYGFEQFIKDTIFFEPSKLSPIKGLYFAGSWVTDGGFQTTLQSGPSAAKAILKDFMDR